MLPPATGGFMNFVTCSHERHAQAILAIFNDAILNSTALYDYKPREPESMVGWFKAKEAGGFPVIGIENENGELAGFASYGTFRAWPAYKYTVEHAVYVRKEDRGRGLGKALMNNLIEAARGQDRHVIIGGIDVENDASVALHRGLGFKHAGTIRQAAYKFGRWLDLAFYQLILETPSAPSEG
jgi:L-amino acid N-acyltransferase